VQVYGSSEFARNCNDIGRSEFGSLISPTAVPFAGTAVFLLVGPRDKGPVARREVCLGGQRTAFGEQWMISNVEIEEIVRIGGKGKWLRGD
jgi:hypothetical protein